MQHFEFESASGYLQDVLVEDPQRRRQIRVTKRGSTSTVVWIHGLKKPPKWATWETMAIFTWCVENANASEDVIILSSEEEHHLWVGYSTVSGTALQI